MSEPVHLSVDEILMLGMLSGLTRAEAARMMLEADDEKRRRAELEADA